METKLISKENGLAKFEMTFTGEEFEAEVVKAYKANRNKFRVDGFRKGKAPRSIIERMYGAGIFWEDAVDGLLNQYPAAIGELGLEVIDSPKVDITSEMAKGQPVVISVEVAIYPEVEVKGYLGVEVDVIKEEATDAEVEADIASLQKRNARQVSVDRAVAEGDTIIFDFAGTVDGEAFEGGTAENFELKVGSKEFIPGFEDQLIGKVKEEEFAVDVTFPENYHSAEVAGKPAVFTCTIHEIKAEELPELDDEFVKDVSEFDTMDELKADTKRKLTERKAAMNEAMAKDALLNKIVEANKPAAPAVMVEDEVKSMLQEIDQQLAMSGLNLSMYAQYMQTTEDKMKDEMREEAAKRVELRMVVRAIAEAEKVEASDEDVNKLLENIGAQYGMVAEDVKKAIGEAGLNQVVQDAKMQNAMDLIWEKAVKNEIDPPAVDVQEVTE